MGSRNFRLLSATMLLAFLSGVILTSCGNSAGGSEKKQAPNFRLKSLAGNTVRLSDYRGKVVIVDFWATWCPPCRKEIPDFVSLFREFSGRGLMILGISLDHQGEKVVKNFVRKYGVNYPILMTDGKVDQLYGGVSAIPTTFIIDREGIIRKKHVGYRPKNVFKREVKELLGE